MKEAKRTPWYQRNIAPARPGLYECAVQITSSAPALLWKLEWDGAGFLVPVPMVVQHWRGLTAPQGEEK